MYQEKIIFEIKVQITSELAADRNACMRIGCRYDSGTNHQIVTGSQWITTNLILGNCDQLRIAVNGLHWGDTVTITDIKVGGITLQHYIYQGRQFQPNVDHFYQPGTEFKLDGIYELDITLPTWRWIMNNIEREIREHKASVS
jgi:hypothetical protein